MMARARSGVGSAGIAAAMLATLAFLPFTPAPAVSAEGEGAWMSAGVTGGAALPDGDLANYRWDTRPNAAWGVMALAGRGRFAAGARASRWSTTQQVSQSPAMSAAVRNTTIEAVGRARIARVLGMPVAAGVSAGRLALDYRPGAVEVPGAGTVALEPVREWIAGAGLSVQQSLPHGWSAGLSLDREFHSLDTAHRRGEEIVYGRESFGTWNARFELARTFALHGKGTTR
ncbi:MAG: hypothetical protein IT348_06085 [Candidatus Eisenbacteria bacterium]|nr:hypothetical protein [Candidatus Eisenbacteria bacterium]